MTKNKKIGLVLIFLPFLVVGFVILLYLAMGLFDSNSSLSQGLNVGLSLFGILAVAISLIGIPVGVYFIRKGGKDALDAETKQLPQFQNLSDEQYKFVTSWSWGAFFSPTIWALGNKLYAWALLSFIPIVNLYIWFNLAINGRKMAWEKGGWDDFEHFRYRQKVMTWIILIVFIFIIIGFVLDSKKAQLQNLNEVKADEIQSLLNETDNKSKEGDIVQEIESKQVASSTVIKNQYPDDPDGDGLPTSFEESFGFGASPNLYDTDGDGYSDLEEIQNCYDPTKPSAELTGQDLKNCEMLVEQLKELNDFLVAKNTGQPTKLDIEENQKHADAKATTVMSEDKVTLPAPTTKNIKISGKKDSDLNNLSFSLVVASALTENGFCFDYEPWLSNVEIGVYIKRDPNPRIQDPFSPDGYTKISWTEFEGICRYKIMAVYPEERDYYETVVCIENNVDNWHYCSEPYSLDPNFW